MAKAAEGRKTRAQRSEEIRDALFHAAAEAVGEHGYAETSIARITQRAKFAQGTFYNYFASRQEIFDELLPVLGVKMMMHIRQAALAGTGFFEREELAFRAFFSFLKRRPYFLRIMNEAEIFAPKAHRAHFRNVSEGYKRFLRRAGDDGEIAKLGSEGLEALAYVLMSARGYLALRYLKPEGSVDIPEEAVAAYMQLVRNGLAARTEAASAEPIRKTG